jgi:hypothetical protein
MDLQVWEGLRRAPQHQKGGGVVQRWCGGTLVDGRKCGWSGELCLVGGAPPGHERGKRRVVSMTVGGSMERKKNRATVSSP